MYIYSVAILTAYLIESRRIKSFFAIYILFFSIKKEKRMTFNGLKKY